MSKTALIILDGFGITPEQKGNAVLNAKTPNLDMIIPMFPKALLKASAEEVGLPWGEFGSSEVGHTAIGLGRVILQNLPQITTSFENKTFEEKSIFKEILSQIDYGSVVNIIFVLSDGGVHGHMEQTISLVKIIKEKRPNAQIKLHVITDGRDTAEKSAKMYLKDIQDKVGKLAEIASIMGRFYAMDRDKNWDRIQLAYDAITGKGKPAESPEKVIEDTYEVDKTDEFIEPFSISQSLPDLAKDIFIFTNFRTDRAIQMTRAFADSSLIDIKRNGISPNFYTMTTYDDNLGLKVLFTNLELNDVKTNPLSNPLVKLISDNNKSQFHVAETEKFAHITYFFSGGIKEDFSGQQDKLIQSKKLQSYDVFPQMRAPEITEEIIFAAEKNFDFIVANFANGDMVGHSGNYQATISAVNIMDGYLGKAVGQLLKNGYIVYITADHGNCDEMIDFNSGKPNKEHTLNPVPFICCDLSRKGKYSSKEEFFAGEPLGVLADVSPTILSTIGLQKAAEMSGLDLTDQLK